MSEREKAEFKADCRAWDEAKAKHPRREDLREALYRELSARYRAEIDR